MASLRSGCLACRLLLIEQAGFPARPTRRSARAYDRSYATTSSGSKADSDASQPVASFSETPSPSPTTSSSSHASTSHASSPEPDPPTSQLRVTSEASGSTSETTNPSFDAKRPSFDAAVAQTRALALSRLASIRLAAFNKLQKQQEELSKRFSQAGQKINSVTGYGDIERLKAEVTRQELELLEARQAAREAKEAHAAALSERMASSREVNDLLQRKASWIDTDVLRFTQLVREDHANEAKERDTKIGANREEERVERKIGEMMQAILKRYHEEQIWSDKIRSVSTYGSLAITGINVLIFLLALVLVEPWKRKRMVGEVEARIREHDKEARETLNGRLDAIQTLVGSSLQEGPIPVIDQDLPASATPLSEGSLEASSLEKMPQPRPDIFLETEATANLPRDDPAAVGSAPPLTAQSDSTEQRHKRNVTYVGLAGAFLGAGAVAAINALFS